MGGLNKSMLVQHTSLGIDDRERLFGGTHGHVLVVADGMGGLRNGVEASSAAVDRLTHYVLDTMPWFFGLDGSGDDDQLDVLEDALRSCEEQLRLLMESRPAAEGMGTTLTMAYVLWPRAYVVHVGDSRCYLWRDSRLRQITRDHTVAQSMVEQGTLSEEEAEGSQWSHVLWNAIGGTSGGVLPDGYRVELRIGDALLLCTDGLTRHVDDTTIARTLRECERAEDVCSRLVSEANRAGGSDNTTVVVARFLDMEPRTEEAETAAAAERPSEAGAPVRRAIV